MTDSLINLATVLLLWRTLKKQVSGKQRRGLSFLRGAGKVVNTRYVEVVFLFFILMYSLILEDRLLNLLKLTCL